MEETSTEVVIERGIAYPYSYCYFLQQAIRAFRTCLGIDSPSPEPDTPEDDVEEFDINRPGRPRISPGSPGQIN